MKFLVDQHNGLKKELLEFRKHFSRWHAEVKLNSEGTKGVIRFNFKDKDSKPVSIIVRDDKLVVKVSDSQDKPKQVKSFFIAMNQIYMAQYLE